MNDKNNKFNRKPIVTLITVNIILLIFILLLIEFASRLIGFKTIFEEEFRQNKNNYKLFCRKYRKGGIIHENLYFTDSDGIFKCRPGQGINSDGFRSVEFKYLDTSVTKILLLGNSFTWGASAKPKKNCFADLLQDYGYRIYNSGIPATDPLQYAKIAKKYIPLLRPDVTAVMLYLGNDINIKPNPIKPGKNLYYVTNAAWLRGYDDKGRYFDNFEEALNYHARKRCGKCTNFVDWFLYKTIIGKVVSNFFSKDNVEGFKQKGNINQWVIDALKEIKICCEKNGSKFFLFLIPVRPDLKYNNHIKRCKHIFQDFVYYCPTNLTMQDYMRKKNDHFNNQGHKKYLEFMKKVFNEKGIHPLKDN